MQPKYVAMLSALLASICCVGPLLLIAAGLGAGAAFIGRYHWFFLVAGLAVLTWAWTKHLREKTVCDCEHRKMESRRSRTFTLLVATMIVLGFAALNVSRYVFASSPESKHEQVANGFTRIAIAVKGMTCVTCEIVVRHALRKVDGVKTAQVSVATNTATVVYDPAETNPDQLAAAINSTGYHATLPRK